MRMEGTDAMGEGVERLGAQAPVAVGFAI